jgi:ABC-type Mn2+/Zn2+ transport system permease subunit
MILLVRPREVWSDSRFFSPLEFCILFCAEISCLSRSIRDTACAKGLRVRWWDFPFYVVFGWVVTSFVRIAGVLLSSVI